MTKDISAFAERARQIDFVRRVTHDLYNRKPNTDKIIPNKYSALANWPLIDAGYMGIEQTLKLLLQYNGRQVEYTHDLWKLYKELDCSQKNTAESFYQVYFSLHKNLISSDEFHCLSNLRSFIKHVRTGYVDWRYLPYEDKGKLPKMHVGLLLESWSALVRVLPCTELGAAPPQRLETRLASFFDQEVFGALEESVIWLGMSQDKSSGIDFMDVHTWVQSHGGHLQAGLFLLQNFYNKTWWHTEKPTLLHTLLLNSGEKAIEEAFSGTGKFSYRDTPFPSQDFFRWDVLALSCLLKEGSLTWDQKRHMFRFHSKH